MTAPQPEQTFDYVVIGGGTAGCALAARLSEEPSIHVALVEAGGSNDHVYVRTPAAVAAAIGHPKLNWGLKTVPQSGMNGRQNMMPRGRVLGGSGSLNGMVYFRGHPFDYQDWARDGATGWSYADVLPYFTRSENNENFPASVYHGRGGPMNVRLPGQPNPMNRVFIDSVVALGYPACDDFAGPNPEGAGLRQATIRAGRRESTATSFLATARGRANLTVFSDTLARKIVFDARRAVAVEVRSASETLRLTARREIILCAGAVHSPHILMCSGIGDQAELSRLGIPSVHHLPAVGRNLHDHPASPVRMRTTNTDPYGLSLRTLPRSVGFFFEYLLGKKGPLSSNVFESAAFLRTVPELDRPDFQFVFQPANPPKPGHSIPMGHGYGISPVLLYPKSRGRITLSSGDITVQPVIDPQLLSDPSDALRMVRAVQLCRRILGSSRFDPYQGNETQPGTQVVAAADIEQFIRQSAYTVHHPVGTCRMGSDADSVVDLELRVRGIEGLRIADASIFPSIVGGNTNAPTVMVAERACDFLLGRPTLKPAVLPANDIIHTYRG
jgi:choline dehydrogenase